MPNEIKGSFTLEQMILLTHTNKPNRFEYMERDVLKRVVMIEQRVLHPDRPHEPDITYIFRTESYPQYKPYTNHTRYSKQRKYKHHYESILSLRKNGMGQLSLQSYDWKYRLGTQKKWKDKPPQAQIKTLYPETEEKWKKDRDKKIDLIERRNIKREEKIKLIKKEKEAYKKRVEQHKKSAKYLDVGDYNSQVNGLNGDFKFRCENVFAHYGHLYGRNTGEGDGDIARPFCPKHMLRLLNFLIKQGVLV